MQMCRDRHVHIASWYPNVNGSHFGFPPSSIHRMTGLGGKMVWAMTHSHRPIGFLYSLRNTSAAVTMLKTSGKRYSRPRHGQLPTSGNLHWLQRNEKKRDTSDHLSASCPGEVVQRSKAVIILGHVCTDRQKLFITLNCNLDKCRTPHISGKKFHSLFTWLKLTFYYSKKKEVLSSWNLVNIKMKFG